MPASSFTTRRRARGFTMIELMVVLAIVALLTSLAAPSARRIYRSAVMSNAVNTFLADIRFARSESIRLGGNVVLCRSNAPESPNPACDGGSGPDGNGWVSGWVVFHDLDADGNKDASDLILRVQGPVKGVNSIVQGTPRKFQFAATGRLKSLQGGISQLTFGSNDAFDEDQQRVVCVNVGGRARIAGDGYTECA